MLSILNYTVLPQFEHLYSMMDVKLNLSQTIITYLISHLPQIFLFFFTLLTLSIIIFIFLNKLDISKNLHSFLTYQLYVLLFDYKNISTC